MRKTKNSGFFQNTRAVSEVTETVILLAVAIAFFAVIFYYTFPVPFPTSSPNVDLTAYVDEDNIIIEHKGGMPLRLNDTIITVKFGMTQQTGSFVDTTNINWWDIGEIFHYNYPYSCDAIVGITVVDTISNSILLDGELQRGYIEYIGPILFSSLLTNTTDEDLICYAYLRDNPHFNEVTRIYQWHKNGAPITNLLLPFDSENSTTTKDYSGNTNNGTVYENTWTSNGKLGGAYYYDGSNAHIELDVVPTVFYDIPNNDFTISMWIKSDDIDDPWRESIEIREDGDHSVQFFQYGSAIHLGITDAGTKRAVKTGRLSTDVWYHIAGVWEASENSLIIYLNGEPSSEPGNNNYATGPPRELMHLGQGPPGSRNWQGYIDEVMIYDYALSSEQIYQEYMDTKDGLSRQRVIVSEETSLGEVWMCKIAPNNRIEDGDIIDSNSLMIIPYPGGQT